MAEEPLKKSVAAILNAYREALADGLTRRETAERFGIHPQSVSSYARRHGLHFRRQTGTGKWIRLDRIDPAIVIAEYRGGATLRQVGIRHGISLQRVHQILVAHEHATGIKILRPRGLPRKERDLHT